MSIFKQFGSNEIRPIYIEVGGPFVKKGGMEVYIFTGKHFPTHTFYIEL